MIRDIKVSKNFDSKNFSIKQISEEDGKKINIDKFPHVPDSWGMSIIRKQLGGGTGAFLVKCGSNIYRVSRNVYNNAKF
jgi:hypothetical protein